MALCAWCYGPAHVLLRAGGAQPRAATACHIDLGRARTWAAKAGPVTETHLTTPPDTAPPPGALF
ncbi:hypothetical protein [Actinomadura harenae]|uniref:Uncharacterized protein n=1 Tax=Actinomadura harenae TaxID=2483351 RepID=A0A3M2MG10_9ACTN|nr:hypothetical protein [Actinomadura harenae]RMI47585.1 hypothetical protein EBO15_01405 [Actinomadura harenae]